MEWIGNISILIGLILFIYSIIPLVKGLRNIKVSDIRNKLLKRAVRAFSSSLVLSVFGVGITPADYPAQLAQVAKEYISGKYFGTENTVAVGEETQYPALESKAQEGTHSDYYPSFNIPNETADAAPGQKYVAATPNTIPSEEGDALPYQPNEAPASEVPSQKDVLSEPAVESLPAAAPEPEIQGPADSDPLAEPLPASPIISYVDADGNGLIKGSSRGIYYVPGSPDYESLTHPVAWFTSVEVAEKAGYQAVQE